ncbi:MAG TPA: nucleotide sugar dehydrogenase [Candidatus Bathyarchaeia archaeon]|nr:nucleotide sugar dehydrogenase [Candidatus Bathyarchaeia archaeon]
MTELKTPTRMSVFGLGKLGLPFAVSWAYRGFRVIAADVNPDIVRSVKLGRVTDAEAPVGSMLTKAKSRITATCDLEEAVRGSDASFIIVPTPSNEKGGYSTSYVEQVLEPIGRVLHDKSSFHLVVVVSTVLPGSTETIFKPILERLSGKICGKDFGLCYNPEFIALGEVVSGLLKPDVVLVGESDPQSGAILERMYRRFCSNHPPVERMSLWNAELAKISVNVYVTMKISFANTLASLCEQIPGGDIDIVSHAVGQDSRIGSKYLKGGLGYGGPCFPRDNRAFSCIAEQLGNRARLSKATDEINQDHSHGLSTRILASLKEIENPHVAILGLTYKPNTFVVEESAAMNIAKHLIDGGASVKCYDPAGMDPAKRTMGDHIEFASTARKCLENADFCLIATPWKEFRNLPPRLFLETMRHPTVLDCWRILDRAKFDSEPKLKYLAVGVHSADQ